jgi:DNA-binding SARP family transcriptional activator
VRFGVLGPLEVSSDGPVEVPGARARTVPALLIVHANQVLPAGHLAEKLWPGQPADGAAERGRHRLPGLAGQWPLFPVTGL